MRVGADIIPLQTILLRRLASRGTEGEKRALNTFLSTFYGQSMAAQGVAAALQGSIERFKDSKKSQSINQSEMLEELSVIASLLLTDIQNLSEILGRLESDLTAKPPLFVS